MCISVLIDTTTEDLIRSLHILELLEFFPQHFSTVIHLFNIPQHVFIEKGAKCKQQHKRKFNKTVTRIHSQPNTDIGAFLIWWIGKSSFA